MCLTYDCWSSQHIAFWGGPRFGEAGNVVLRPELLGEFQAYAEKQTGVSKVGAAGGFIVFFFFFVCVCVCVSNFSLKFARELDTKQRNIHHFPRDT